MQSNSMVQQRLAATPDAMLDMSKMDTRHTQRRASDGYLPGSGLPPRTDSAMGRNYASKVGRRASDPAKLYHFSNVQVSSKAIRVLFPSIFFCFRCLTACTVQTCCKMLKTLLLNEASHIFANDTLLQRLWDTFLEQWLTIKMCNTHLAARFSVLTERPHWRGLQRSTKLEETTWSTKERHLIWLIHDLLWTLLVLFFFIFLFFYFFF